MKLSILKYLSALTLLLFPIIIYAGGTTIIDVQIGGTDRADRELVAYYDLRDRQSYVQVTNVTTQNPLCIHVQVFQQDRDCTELDFNDQLTNNDTVVYNLDDMVRNDGSPVPINLADDSYGYVAVSAFVCGTTDNANSESLIGNFRIIDDTGYEYRMNMINSNGKRIINGDFPNNGPNIQVRDVIINYNTVEGANRADIVGFLWNDDRRPARGGGPSFLSSDTIFNVEEGVTFSVFQIDENEERLSCDRVTFGCGPGKVMNYGINEDIPASRGDNLLCEGGGLVEGQNGGYILLDDGVNNITLLGDDDDDGEFACLVGLNNNDGTGSMDECNIGIDKD